MSGMRTAAAVGLASLPAMGPRRLDSLLEVWEPEEAWRRITGGDRVVGQVLDGRLGKEPAEVLSRWTTAARVLDPVEALEAHRRSGIEVLVRGEPGYPHLLLDDPEPPVALFVRGDLEVLDTRRVAIVGTRRCTRSGRLTAREIAADLAAGGVAVVSGLALGIDGAAHEGALSVDGGAAPVGVVGTGLDRVYPKRNAALWERVAVEGLLVSEVPMGSGPSPWRFPARNRIIAALSEVILVVESHTTGGALHTVEEALARDREVLIVPGSVRSPASEGTNALLHAGVGPARDAADVLTALGLAAPVVGAGEQPNSAARPEGRAASPGRGHRPGGAVDPRDQAVLDLVGGEPVNLDRLAESSGLSLGELAVSLVRLESAGCVARSGGFVERLVR